MVISFGRHEGKPAEVLVLNHPDYVMWMLGEKDATGRLAQARPEVRRLVRRFDSKPILKKCQDPDCDRLATRCIVNRGSITPRWLCDVCDPSRECSSPDKLEIIRTYSDCVRYVYFFCLRNEQAMKALLKKLARAKGLPRHADRAEVMAFFRRELETAKRL